jgi:hypothetical protein
VGQFESVNNYLKVDTACKVDWTAFPTGEKVDLDHWV